MKRIISIFLVLVLIFAISFQCTLSTSAIAGVDDVVVLGVCLDLLALGISIYSVQEFCKSDTFRDFCTDIGNHIDSGFSTIKRNGILFLATTKMAWQQICNWVKSHFSGGEINKSIGFDVNVPSNPQSITLKNGTSVPYADWMSNPFFIYTISSGTYGVWCDGSDVGVNIKYTYYRVWCTGHGKCYRYLLDGSSWSGPTEYGMSYGLDYKGVTGSFKDFTQPASASGSFANYMQYRTMEYVNDLGVSQEQEPPNYIPDYSQPVTEYVVASSDPLYYPGAVDAPTEIIDNGESILIEVPESLVVDSGTSNPTLTTDINAIGNTLAQTTSADVKPRVLTNTASDFVSVGEIVQDTPVADLESAVNDPALDLETANKFRLPKSFLEGFPFSIPYSVYVGIQSLVADPQAPVFNIPFSIPRLGIAENVDIDLSQFAPVARLCRALLSLVWVAGLAMACSKFIKR